MGGFWSKTNVNITIFDLRQQHSLQASTTLSSHRIFGSMNLNFFKFDINPEVSSLSIQSKVLHPPCSVIAAFLASTALAALLPTPTSVEPIAI